MEGGWCNWVVAVVDNNMGMVVVGMEVDNMGCKEVVGVDSMMLAMAVEGKERNLGCCFGCNTVVVNMER